MAPIAYAPEESPIEDKKRKAQERELERLRQLEQKRQNPFIGPNPREAQTSQPREQKSERVVQEQQPIQPQAPAPRPAARESAGPSTAAPSPIEQRQTKETTKVERFTRTDFNEETGRYEEREGQNKVIYQELDKIERIEGSSAQEVEVEKERERLQVNTERQTQAQTQRVAPEVVKAIPLEQMITPVSPQELRKNREAEVERRNEEQREKDGNAKLGEKEGEMKKDGKKKDGKLAEVVIADSKIAGPKEESVEKQTARIRQTLDEALERNRPGLVVQAVLDKREAQGPLDLLQIDEHSVQLLQKELESRIVNAKKERARLLTRIEGEKDAGRKRAMRVNLKKVLLNLAFYSKVKGMLSRVLGGFFGKLAGGLMKK